MYPVLHKVNKMPLGDMWLDDSFLSETSLQKYDTIQFRRLTLHDTVQLYENEILQLETYIQPKNGGKSSEFSVQVYWPNFGGSILWNPLLKSLLGYVTELWKGVYWPIFRGTCKEVSWNDLPRH